MDRQVKIYCPRLPVPFTYTGNSVYHHRSAADPRLVHGRNVSGIAGGSEKSSAGGVRAGENYKTGLYCTVKEVGSKGCRIIWRMCSVCH